LSRLDLVETECPADVTDRLLWRNAQRILSRHVVRLDGTCQWCGRDAPCAPRELAERADAVSRLPWHEGWAARNEITRLLPQVCLEEPVRRRGGPAGVARNQRSFD
jgi:hypothetical protein